MRKPPETLVTLAPAALALILVIVGGWFFGFRGETEEAAPKGAPTASATPQASSKPQAREGDIDVPTLIDRRRTLVPRKQVKVQAAYTFQIASFNVLGHSHTVAGGDKARFADSRTRMAWTMQLLNAYSADVVGFQELQPQQLGSFNARTGGAWDIYPGGAMGRKEIANSLAWRTEIFTAVETRTITIPYFGGNPRQMPYVLLQHNATGQRIWVANFHNPARVHGGNENWRNEATRREIALANDLAETGYPVFFTGDFNEREDFFCPVTAQTGLKSASGGSTGTSCQPPAKMQVDWIMGSEWVDFTSYAVAKGGLVARTTDHPVVHASVTVPEKRIQLRHAWATPKKRR